MNRLADLLVRHRTRLRICFWCYAALLFTGTHWPALEVHVPGIERPDLIVHFTLFGAWFAAFWLTAYAGEPLRLRTILIAAVVACVYAGIDEGLQAIPWVRRHCALDDYEANCIGIALAAILASVIAVTVNRKTNQGRNSEQSE